MDFLSDERGNYLRRFQARGNANLPVSEEINSLRRAWCLAQVKEKKSTEEALQWVAQHGLEEELGGKLGVLRMVLRALMVAGSKSFTHMLLALERFDNLLTALLAETGERVRCQSMAGLSLDHFMDPSVPWIQEQRASPPPIAASRMTCSLCTLCDGR